MNERTFVLNSKSGFFDCYGGNKRQMRLGELDVPKCCPMLHHEGTFPRVPI